MLIYVVFFSATKNWPITSVHTTYTLEVSACVIECLLSGLEPQIPQSCLCRVTNASNFIPLENKTLLSWQFSSLS